MKIYICSIEGLADAASYDAASLKIAQCRRDKLSRIKGEADRRRSVCAGLLLNYAVADFLKEESAANIVSEAVNQEFLRTEVPTEKLTIQEISLQHLLSTEKQQFEYKQNGNGKPFICDIPDFHFSLSHSGDYVLCVWDSNEIGADLQRMDRDVKDNLAKKVMNGKEYSAYVELSAQDKQKEFYRVWAIKESFCKLTGKGLSQDFGEIETEKINCYTRLFKEEYWLAVSRYE